MKKTIFFAGAVLISGIALSSCSGNKSCPAASAKLSNSVDSMSYALGINLGTGFAQNLKEIPGGEVNKEVLIAGFIQSLNEDTASYKIKPDEVYVVLEKFFTEARQAEATQAKIKNDSILSANKDKEGVKVTNSGLQYKVITEGKGTIPTKDDVVKVHYTGKLPNGTVFDSSVERGKPAEFPVGAVIKGWTEALQLMPVGSKWELLIPSDLAYGDRAVGDIPANSVLSFEVELLEIVPAADTKK